MAAYVTCGYWGHTVVPELTIMDALKRWDAPKLNKVEYAIRELRHIQVTASTTALLYDDKKFATGQLLYLETLAGSTIQRLEEPTSW